jgi:hypothetical protein
MPKAPKKTTKGASRVDPLARGSGNASKMPSKETSSGKVSSGKPDFPPILAEEPEVPSISGQPLNASDPDPEPNYLLLVHLTGTFSPTIQRTLSVPGSFTFAKLHNVLQAAFGWANCHAHSFDLKLSANRDKEYFMGGPSVLNLAADNDMASSMPDPERYKLEKDYTLADVLEHPEYKGKTYLSYEYDHGDSWEHDITVLGRADPALRNELGGIKQKAFCVAGEGHPCAEDVGSYPVS